MAQTPLIFDIKRYSINDGPGIRITIFFKGCPLNCIWCHNPEGISLKQQKMYSSNKCIGCSYCVRECTRQAVSLTKDGIITDKNLCTLCEKCAAVCPSRATEMAGKRYVPKDLLKEIVKETMFFDSSEGGVTFCGGEPLMHPEFLAQMLDLCGEEDIHRCVDTSFYANQNVIATIADKCELFLIDIKVMDEEKHIKYTGKSNRVILENIRFLAETPHPYWIRVPLIEGVNADRENLEKTAQFIASLKYKPEWINLLVYHDIAKGKHTRLNSKYNNEEICMNAPSAETQDMALEIFRTYNLNVKIGG